MAVTTRTFRIEGMHCASCALLIDGALEELPGVQASATTLKQGRSTVDLDLTKTTPADIVNTIDHLGYRATPMP